MLVALDTNILFSGLLSKYGPPGAIYHAWRSGRFRLVTCREQLEEIRKASRNPKFRAVLQPAEFGKLVNSMHGAVICEHLQHKRHAADPDDSYLLDLIDAAQPDYFITGDRRAGILPLNKLGRTKILTASAFCTRVLRRKPGK
jgi:uncharacterized protein